MRTEIRRSNAVTIGLGALNAADVTRHDIQAFIDVQRQPKVVEVGLNKRGRRGGLQRRVGSSRRTAVWDACEPSTTGPS